MIQGTDGISDEISESIEEIRRSAERATGLTHQLLNIAEVDSLPAKPPLVGADAIAHIA